MKKAISMNTTASWRDGGGARWMPRRRTLRRLASPGPTFNLTAQPAFLNQPDGNQVYSWGYGCTTERPAASRPRRSPTRAARRCRFPDRR